MGIVILWLSDLKKKNVFEGVENVARIVDSIGELGVQQEQKKKSSTPALLSSLVIIVEMI